VPFRNRDVTPYEKLRKTVWSRRENARVLTVIFLLDRTMIRKTSKANVRNNTRGIRYEQYFARTYPRPFLRGRSRYNNDTADSGSPPFYIIYRSVHGVSLRRRDLITPS